MQKKLRHYVTHVTYNFSTAHMKGFYPECKRTRFARALPFSDFGRGSLGALLDWRWHALIPVLVEGMCLVYRHAFPFGRGHDLSRQLNLHEFFY